MRTVFRQETHDSIDMPEPAATLMKTFSGYEGELTSAYFLPILRYFQKINVPEGFPLWEKGDAPDGLYVVESGVLRAIYQWDNADILSESMVAGTLAGELSGLADMPRNASVIAEKQSVLWKLSKGEWTRFKEEQPALAHRFVELVLKGERNHVYLVPKDLSLYSGQKRL